jgi:hypothetical protein
LTRGLAVVSSGAVVAVSALAWGRPGLVAATVGAGLSLINVWVLARLAAGAVALAAAAGPRTAALRLTSALGAKTAVLFTLIWLGTRSGGLPILPLGLGLLVAVFSLVGAGLWIALRTAGPGAE